MNKREKTLLLTLMCVAGVFGARHLLSRLYWIPVENRISRINILEASLDSQNRRNAAIDAAEATVTRYRNQSLPPDPSTGMTLYQNWLIDLSEESGLTSAVVTPNQISTENDAWYRVHFSVDAVATLAQVSAFLDSFYQLELLHAVTNMELDTAEESDDPLLDVRLHIEAVSITSAPARSTLLPEHRVAKPDDSMNRETPYAWLITHNPFARPGVDGGIDDSTNTEHQFIASAVLEAASQLPEEAEEPFAEPPNDVLLIASLTGRNGTEAWLFDRTSRIRTVLLEGRPFEAAGLQGTVVSISKRSVELLVDGHRRTVEVGQSLTEDRQPGE